MPVATLLAVAATFWSAHGYTTTQPVTWSWDTTPIWQTDGVQAHSPVWINADGTLTGQYHIFLVRAWWHFASNQDKSNQDKCVVMIHEYGHAAFGFQHKAHTVMARYDDPSRAVPGTCKRSKAAWRAAARAGA